jgi:hypothetical protein
VELWFATAFAQGVMHIGDGCSEGFSCSVFDGAQEDIIAVVIVCNE